MTKSDSDVLLDGVVYAKRTVRAGFTTVIDLGGIPEVTFAMRDAIAAGKIMGPRMIAAGGVAAHGGHGDIQGYRQEILDLYRSPTLCSGADDCARAVRQAVQSGADIIKTASTGGVMSATAAGVGQQMSDAELTSLVETAHRPVSYTHLDVYKRQARLYAMRASHFLAMRLMDSSAPAARSLIWRQARSCDSSLTTNCSSLPAHTT